jgi:hypothetical protein
VYDLKNSFYEEIGSVFDQFSRYDMIFFGGEFNTNVGREDIFKPIIWNEISQEIIYDNGIRVVNFAIGLYKNLAPCSPIAAFINIHGPLLMDRCTTRLIKF